MRGPHLVLAHAGDIDGIRPGDLAEFGYHVLRAEAAIGLRIPTQRIGLLQAVQIGPPVGQIGIVDALVADPVVPAAVLAQHLNQLGDDGFDIADDRHIGMAVLADLGRVDIGVNHLGAGREGVQLAGHPVVEAGTEGDQQITLLQAGHRGDGAVHTRHTEILAVTVRERPAGHQRGDHWDTGQLGQFQQFLARLTADHAAADIQHRLAGRDDQFGSLLDLTAVRFGVGLVPGKVHLGRPDERALTLQHILGDVDQHRTVSAGGGNVERLGQRPGDVISVANQDVVLGDRHRHTGDVGLLEGVRADQAAAHLTGDRDHRNRVHLGVGQRGDEIRRARTRRGHHDADLAGDVGVATGGVPGALLVSDQDVAQLRRIEQRIVNGQHRAAGNAEDQLDAEFLQRLHYRLGAGELVGLDALGMLTPVAGFVGDGSGGAGRRLGRSRGRCAHCCPRYPRCWFGSVGLALLVWPCWFGKKKPPSAWSAVRGLRAGACG